MEDNLLTDEEINAFVQYEAGNHEYFKLDKEQAERIKAKIQDNDISRRRYLESRRHYAEIGNVLKKKRTLSPMMVAASLLILFGFSFLFIYRSSQRLTGDAASGPVAVELDLGSNEAGEALGASELLAVNYQAYEEFENYVNYGLRDVGNFYAAPEKDAVVIGPVTLTWENDGAPLTFKLYDNQGKMIQKVQKVDASLVLDDLAEPGLYYWSLENEEEVIHWSKFYLR